MTPTNFHKTVRIIALVVFGFTLSTAGIVQSSEATCPCNKRMEKKLKSDYTYYADNFSVLEFKFQVNKQENHVDVTLVGQNFGPWDSDWTGKDTQAFLGYLGSIGQEIENQMRKSLVLFRVIDLENHELGKFQYGK